MATVNMVRFVLITMILFVTTLGPAEGDDQHNRESQRRHPSTKVAGQSKWSIELLVTLISCCVTVEAEQEKAQLEAGKCGVRSSSMQTKQSHRPGAPE
jgi:hypothetical protein